MAKAPSNKKNIPVDLSLLSAEDKAALDKEAQASILEGMKQDARDAYFAQRLTELRREQVPEDQLVNVTIDVAPFVPFIMLDGVQFFHGYTYAVPVKQAAVLYEQAYQSWRHQDEIDGRAHTEAYRPSATHGYNRRELNVGLQHAGTPTRGANGVIIT